MKTVPVTKSFVKKYLPVRSRRMNKTHGGKLLVIAGSKGMYGAGILSALAGTRTGAGYTYLMMDWSSKDLLTHPDILFVKQDAKKLNSLNVAAHVFGPGIGQSPKSLSLLKLLIKNKASSVVLDADGLNLLAKMKNVRLPQNWVLTPHEGELSRLLDIPSEKIRKNPKVFLTQAQKKYGCVILLKGPITYITDGNNIFTSKAGTPALAKAGTGDVLSGIIGALLAQQVLAPTAAAIGAYIHGLASRRFLKAGNDSLSLRPTDLIDYLPKILKTVRR